MNESELHTRWPNWHWIPQGPSVYHVHPTCQIENFGWLLEQLPPPFGPSPVRGRFVEVGAFDGITYSNSWGLAWAGWHGIMVEPMPENIKRCVQEHQDKPWVIIEPVAAGAHDGTLSMFFEREGSRVSKDGEATIEVPVMTLNSILESHHWTPDFDLLSSDTEDHELEVMAGFDLNYWKPKLCIIETHGPIRAAVHKIFDDKYRTFFEDGLNTLFVRKDWCP